MIRVTARTWMGGPPASTTEGDRAVAEAAVRQALDEGHRHIVVEEVYGGDDEQ